MWLINHLGSCFHPSSFPKVVQHQNVLNFEWCLDCLVQHEHICKSLECVGWASKEGSSEKSLKSLNMLYCKNGT